MPRMSDDEKAFEDLVQMTAMAEAWERIKPDKVIGGVSLQEFKAVLKKCHDAHAEVIRLEGRKRALERLQEESDRRTLALLDAVLADVKAHPDKRISVDLYNEMTRDFDDEPAETPDEEKPGKPKRAAARRRARR